MITFQLLHADLPDVETDLVVVPIFSDLIPLKGEAGHLDWRLNGRISRLIKNKKISGTFEEVTLLYRKHKIACGAVLLAGFGKTADLDSVKLAAIYSYIGETVKSMGKKSFALSLPIPSSTAMDDYEGIALGFVRGLAASLTEDRGSGDYTIAVVEKNETDLEPLRTGLDKAIKSEKLSGKMKIAVQEFGVSGTKATIDIAEPTERIDNKATGTADR